jgi:hypothetical protein
VLTWRPGRVRAIERIEDPTEADARVLDHLAKLGCDPSQPRECRHYLYLPDEDAAGVVANALAAGGLDAQVEEVAGGWLVTAGTVTVLDDRTVRTTRVRLERLAAEHGGEYDGWEAAAD